MSLNTAHINGGVLIHNGECILVFSDKVTIEWLESTNDPAFKGTKKGRIYLTAHRMIFNSSSNDDKMPSFSFPFVTLSNVDIEQPVFGANYIKGMVVAQQNGNWQGRQTFKLTFKHGGAIEFGRAMLKAASLGEMATTPPVAMANLAIEKSDETAAPVPTKTYKSKKVLAERLDEFCEDPQLLSKNPNVVDLPPPMVPVEAKLLFYDLAFNYVQFPKMRGKEEDQEKKESAGLTGFVKILWGWGKKYFF